MNATIRVLILLALSLGALAWGAVQFTAYTIEVSGEDHEPSALQDFLAEPLNPPVCYYEGVSETTERPTNMRDWAYTLVLGDCHPQVTTLPKLLIDALVPVSAGSLSVQVPDNPVQYPQTFSAVDTATDPQERQ